MSAATKFKLLRAAFLVLLFATLCVVVSQGDQP